MDGQGISSRRRAFVDAFASVELLAWSSEEFSSSLAACPRAALAEFGIRVPAGVRVVLVPSRGGAPVESTSVEMAQALAAWERGWSEGELLIWIPADRHVPTGALSDDELAGVIGGHRVTSCYANACCAAG